MGNLAGIRHGTGRTPEAIDLLTKARAPPARPANKLPKQFRTITHARMHAYVCLFFSHTLMRTPGSCAQALTTSEVGQQGKIPADLGFFLGDALTTAGVS